MRNPHDYALALRFIGYGLLGVAVTLVAWPLTVWVMPWPWAAGVTFAVLLGSALYPTGFLRRWQGEANPNPAVAAYVIALDVFVTASVIWWLNAMGLTPAANLRAAQIASEAGLGVGGLFLLIAFAGVAFEGLRNEPKTP